VVCVAAGLYLQPSVFVDIACKLNVSGSHFENSPASKSTHALQGDKGRGHLKVTEDSADRGRCEDFGLLRSDRQRVRTVCRRNGDVLHHLSVCRSSLRHRAQCLYSLFHRREAKVTGCCNNDRDSAKSTHALQGDIIYSDGYLSIDDVSMVVRLYVMMQVAIAC